MTGGAGQFFKMNGRDTRMVGGRGTQPSCCGFLPFGAQVAAFTGQTGHIRIVRFVAAGNLVVCAMPVTIGTFQARIQVNVFIASPFRVFGHGHILHGMAEITPFIGDIAGNIDKNLLIFIENRGVVGDGDSLIDGRIEKVRQRRGGSIHNSHSGCRGIDPAVILPTRLQGRQALILAEIGIMAGQTVDLPGTADFLAEHDLRILFSIGELSEVIAGYVAAESADKIPLAHAKLRGTVHSRPVAFRDGQHGTGFRVGQHKRLSRAAIVFLRVGQLKMPAMRNHIKCVALAARFFHGKRPGICIRGTYRNAGFIHQLHQVDRRVAVSIVTVANQGLLGPYPPAAQNDQQYTS